jgi:hypothetical protein
VVTRTDAGTPLAADRLIVNATFVVPLLPSDTVGELTVIVGAASSLVIVPMPCASVTVASLGFVRFTKNASVGSNVVSPTTLTVNCWVATDGPNVSVPDFVA